MVKPVSEIGKYGGEQHGAAFGPKTGQLDTEALRMQSLLFIEPDLQTLSPNIFKAYQASDDFKTWTLTLRKGMKWSDGAAVHCRRFSVLVRGHLPQHRPDACAARGVYCGRQADDHDQSRRCDAEGRVCGTEPELRPDDVEKPLRTTGCMRPSITSQQWHIKYNDKADDVAKSEKFETWVLAFQLPRRSQPGASRTPNCPTSRRGC